MRKPRVIVSDRYSATGTPRPKRDTVCIGQCEGMGCVPIRKGETREPFKSLWLEAEAKSPSDDGYHFVECPDCKGPGKRPQ